MQGYGSLGGSTGVYGGAYGTAYGSAEGGSAYLGAMTGSDSAGRALSAMLPTKKGGHRRMNIVSMFFSLIVPWIVFCLIFGMLSFEMHYRKPDLCKTLCIISGVVIGLCILVSLLLSVQKRFFGSELFQEPSWLLFIAVTSMVALAAGIAAGNRNFKVNTQPYFDISALNTYSGVDIARMRGQELMDAGKINFIAGTHIDTGRAMGFKNFDTYCVAPITITGNTVEGTPPLASYDFWAVGKDCCDMPATGSVDFRCGEYDNPRALGGIRALDDEDRAFYRLAVQQAQSTYGIRAVHPLFFHWVQDPGATALSSYQASYKVMLSGIFVYFGFQMVLVYVAVSCFTAVGLGSY